MRKRGPVRSARNSDDCGGAIDRGLGSKPCFTVVACVGKPRGCRVRSRVVCLLIFTLVVNSRSLAPSYRRVTPFKARHKTNTTCVPIAAFPALTASHFSLSFLPLVSCSRTTFIDTNATTTRQLYAPKFISFQYFLYLLHLLNLFPIGRTSEVALTRRSLHVLRPPSGPSRRAPSFSNQRV